MDNIKPIPPFKRFCGMLGAFPEAFSDAMTVYEALEWLYRYLGTEVVPKTNEAIELVNQLKEYVDHYFDNLDVQEEINNKLDEMAESGQLTEIIAGYLEIRSVLAYNNVAAMKAADNLVDGSFAETYGFYAKGDGGGAKYKIRQITNSDTVDNILLFSITESQDLVAELIVDEQMNVKQFGVKADGETDCASRLATAISLNKGCLYFPVGTYLVNSPVDITDCKNITGEDMEATVIKAPNGFLTWSDGSYYRNISNLKIDGVEINNNTAISGILCISNIENVIIKNFEYGIDAKDGSWMNEFNHILIQYCSEGVTSSDTTSRFNNNTFVNVVFQHIDDYAVNLSGHQNKYVGCNFESCGACFHYAGRLLSIDGCYIEGNNKILDINTSSANSSVVFDNCWLEASANNTQGWLACLYCSSSVDTATSSLLIKNCEIRSGSDTYKPFAFQGEGNQSYWGVSVENNSYVDVANDSYNIYYDDLFDLTNCTNYGTSTNPVTFTSDLPLYAQDGIVWFRKNLGNTRGALRTNIMIEMKGTYSVTSTSGDITIALAKRYGSIYPAISNLPVTVRFTDGSYQTASCQVGPNNIVVTPVYGGKTTDSIIFNNVYSSRFAG